MAGFTFESGPDAVELVHGRFYKVKIIGQNASLKVAVSGSFHADARTREIRRADVSQFAVKYQNFEMDARTKGTFQSREEDRVLVKVFAEVGSRFLGMNEAHFPALLDQVSKDSEGKGGQIENIARKREVSSIIGLTEPSYAQVREFCTEEVIEDKSRRRKIGFNAA